MLFCVVAGAVVFFLNTVSRSNGLFRTSSITIGQAGDGKAEIGMAGTVGNVAFDSVANSRMAAPTMQALPAVYPSYSVSVLDAVRGGELYIQDTSLSLISRDPVNAEAQIRQITTELGGFLVSSNVDHPEEGTTASITVRVPTDSLDEALQRFEQTGDRVVSKSVQGRDVTQQYQDIEAQLATLNTVQTRLEALLQQADDASALLQIQQQIFQIQSQKDSLEGQRRYLEDAAETTRVTIFIASDELALPYVPAQPWKPEAIFKQAVRSLVETLRGFGTAVIWIAVYLPLAVPVLLLIWWWLRHSRRK